MYTVKIFESKSKIFCKILQTLAAPSAMIVCNDQSVFRYVFLQGLVSTTSIEWSSLCLFYCFFASLSARLDFKREKINERKKKYFLPPS